MAAHKFFDVESLIGLIGHECLYVYRHVTNEVEKFRIGVGVLQEIEGTRSAESGEIVEQKLMMGVPNLGAYTTMDAQYIEYLGSMDAREEVPRIGDEGHVEGEQTHREVPNDTEGNSKKAEVPFPLDHIIDRAKKLAESDALPHSEPIDDIEVPFPFGTEGLKQ